MAELFAYNEKVETIFDLIGDQENDITKNIAWAFGKGIPAATSVIADFFAL